jgi:hypothetical protein
MIGTHMGTLQWVSNWSVVCLFMTLRADWVVHSGHVLLASARLCRPCPHSALADLFAS